MRTLGVPARWESGWMMHPGEVNYHDWAEVYFEGVGWVPVDVSFGRYDNASGPRARKFYSTGIDAYRMAANSGVCGPLLPAKRRLSTSRPANSSARAATYITPVSAVAWRCSNAHPWNARPTSHAGS